MATHADIARRTLAATLAAAIPTATLAGPLSADTCCTAELLELGRKLDEAVREARAFRPTYDAACQAVEDGMHDPVNREAFHRAKHEHAPDEGFSVLYRYLFGEHDKVIGRGNDLIESAGKLAEGILTRPARTVAELGVHARALAWTFSKAWDSPLEDP